MYRLKDKNNEIMVNNSNNNNSFVNHILDD